MFLQQFLDKQNANAAAGSWNNKENAAATSFLNNNDAPAVCALGATARHCPRPESELATLCVSGFDKAIQDSDVFYLFGAFDPIVCVDRPKDEHGSYCSRAYVTLLSHEADDAIELLDGRRLLNNLLQVKKVKNKRKVSIAVALKGRNVCRAFRNGHCLEHCPFRLEHRGI